MSYLVYGCWEVWVFISFLVGLVLFFFCSFFSSYEDMFDSMSPFECGMESIKESRLPLSMQFFSIVFLFLIFDVELVLILPMIFVSCLNEVWLVFWLLIFFFIMLGLLMEIFWNSVDWKD